MAPSDPYTAKASQDASPTEKINELKKIISQSKFAMLTTRGSNGLLHSRAMSPADTSGLVFQFIANTESGKFDDLEANPDVNISYSDPSSTNWASAAGKATIVTDNEQIKAVWNPAVKAWFGDLGDGKHTGNYDDPRVAVIRVEPAEIRYWYATKGTIGQAIDVAKGALTGETAAPGVLRVIGEQDLHVAKSMDNK
ncbi:hypothetical protein OIO90_001743 [Microbotryomycetes sp. JL221]|nr:hypothetical protein OIO90_001743 [Microbotryomycetes sp. JL221]